MKLIFEGTAEELEKQADIVNENFRRIVKDKGYALLSDIIRGTVFELSNYADGLLNIYEEEDK